MYGKVDHTILTAPQGQAPFFFKERAQPLARFPTRRVLGYHRSPHQHSNELIYVYIPLIKNNQIWWLIMVGVHLQITLKKAVT